MSKEKFAKKLNELVDNSSQLTPEQKALWHIFSFYATEEENEALVEAIEESEENLSFLTTYLLEKVKQLYEEDL